jgi:hypothetical protein
VAVTTVVVAGEAVVGWTTSIIVKEKETIIIMLVRIHVVKDHLHLIVEEEEKVEAHLVKDIMRVLRHRHAVVDTAWMREEKAMKVTLVVLVLVREEKENGDLLLLHLVVVLAVVSLHLPLPLEVQRLLHPELHPVLSFSQSLPLQQWQV